VKRTRKLPLLVIVSGPSASGKTSIVRDLAAELGAIVLSKDDVKEALFDTLGNPADEDESGRLDIASLVVMERLGRRILEGGASLVVEGNFWRNQSEMALGPLAARARAAIVHFTVAPATMAARIKKRIEGSKERHPGHSDDAAHVVALLDKPAELVGNRPDVEPPNLDLPIRQIDTSGGKVPSAEQIAEWVKQVTRAK
jgi:predicted kinase